MLVAAHRRVVHTLVYHCCSDCILVSVVVVVVVVDIAHVDSKVVVSVVVDIDTALEVVDHYCCYHYTWMSQQVVGVVEAGVN